MVITAWKISTKFFFRLNHLFFFLQIIAEVEPSYSMNIIFVWWAFRDYARADEWWALNIEKKCKFSFQITRLHLQQFLNLCNQKKSVRMDGKKEWKNNQDKCKNCSHFPSDDEQRANKPERSTANSSIYSFSSCLFVSLSMMEICCYYGKHWEEVRYLGEIVTLIEFN